MKEEVIAFGSQVLWIVNPCQTCNNRRIQQQIGKCIAGNLRLSYEINQTARLHIAESILLGSAKIETEFHDMQAMCIGCIVRYLIGVGNTLLRIVEFLPK